jgi:hypothetical protein
MLDEVIHKTPKFNNKTMTVCEVISIALARIVTTITLEASPPAVCYCGSTKQMMRLPN